MNLFAKAALPVLLRPWLWWTALVQVRRIAPQRWWARAPFLPTPRGDFIEFRLITQYGGDESQVRSRIVASDVLDYLEWCRQWNKQK